MEQGTKLMEWAEHRYVWCCMFFTYENIFAPNSYNTNPNFSEWIKHAPLLFQINMTTNSHKQYMAHQVADFGVPLNTSKLSVNQFSALRTSAHNPVCALIHCSGCHTAHSVANILAGTSQHPMSKQSILSPQLPAQAGTAWSSTGAWGGWQWGVVLGKGGENGQVSPRRGVG